METSILQTPLVHITTARIQIGGTMIPVAAVASVSSVEHPAERTKPILGAVASAGLAALAGGGSALGPLFAVAAAVFAVVAFRRATSFSVSVVTSAGHQKLLETPSREYAQGIADAIHRAVASR